MGSIRPQGRKKSNPHFPQRYNYLVLWTMASFYLVLPSFHVSSTTTQLLRYDSTLLGFTEFPQSPVTEFSILPSFTGFRCNDRFFFKDDGEFIPSFT